MSGICTWVCVSVFVCGWATGVYFYRFSVILNVQFKLFRSILIVSEKKNEKKEYLSCLMSE